MQRKLLIVIDEMEVGGSQKNIVDMARHIDTSAFEVSVVFFRKPSPYVEELRSLGVEVTQIPKRRRIDPVFFVRLCKFIRRNDFDLIHAFSFSGEVWSWLANAMTGGRSRFVSTVHSVYEWYSPLQWMIKRWVTLGSAALIANSRAGADYAALRMGIRRETVDVVLNGVALPPAVRDDEAAARAVARKPGTPLRLLFVGRLVTHKNLDCLLRAFASVAQRDPDVELDLVGDGPLRRHLETLAKTLGVGGRVIFHGEQNDVVPYLLKSDIFVMTSHREGLSNAVMEAMSAGLPVVASNVGGNPELVTHEQSGMLFPADDHETLAEMLLELLHDDVKRERLGQNARMASQRFNDPRRMTAEMERIYERSLLEQGAYVVRR